jgi:hypothetical protein
MPPLQRAATRPLFVMGAVIAVALVAYTNSGKQPSNAIPLAQMTDKNDRSAAGEKEDEAEPLQPLQPLPLKVPTHEEISSIVWDAVVVAMQPALADAKNRFEEGLEKEAECTGGLCHFSDIRPLPFPPSMVQRGNGESQKTMLTGILSKEKDDCIVYGIGISTDSSFEQHMATQNCKVFGFDCTITEEADSVKGKDYTFLPICIGDDTASDQLGKGWSLVNQKSENQTRLFQPLSQVMSTLNHTKVDILKFDVEGNEWTLFESILAAPFLPRQLNFELHLMGANPGPVPPALVQGKRRKAVNEVMLRLLEVGYGVVSLEPNPGDRYCAEVTMVLMK